MTLLSLPGCAQARSPFFDQRAVHLRHTCGRGAGAWRKWKDVQPCQVAFGHQRQCVLEMRLCLGGEACDDVRPKGHVRPQFAGLLRELDGIVPQGPPLHPFEDQIVPVLQAEMQVWHQPVLSRDGLHKRLIHFDRVD